MTSQQESFTFNIPARGFGSLRVDAQETEGFWIFEVQVEQPQGSLYDISAYVLDHDNFLVWQTRQQTARAGARTSGLPPVSMLLSTKLNWSPISVRPPSPGQYYLVLDNSHSSLTPKTVHVLAYWVSQESASLKAVRQSLLSLGWDSTWELFEKAENGLMEKQLAGSCFYMRVAIATLWKQVVEKKSGQPVNFDPGKSTDIGALQRPMESYVPNYVLSTVRQSWSLASELAHTEKRGGQEPPLDQVILALRYAYASAAFLVSLIRT